MSLPLFGHNSAERILMPDLFSIGSNHSHYWIYFSDYYTAVAKASDSVLAWLKFKKEQKIEPSQLLAE